LISSTASSAMAGLLVDGGQRLPRFGAEETEPIGSSATGVIGESIRRPCIPLFCSSSTVTAGS
jgi:hypothetical protein